MCGDWLSLDEGRSGDCCRGGGDCIEIEALEFVQLLHPAFLLHLLSLSCTSSCIGVLLRKVQQLSHRSVALTLVLFRSLLLDVVTAATTLRHRPRFHADVGIQQRGLPG